MIISQAEQAAIILQKIVSICSKNDKATTCNNKNGFYVIPGNNSPRWIVPSNPKLGQQVLAQWRPYGVASQLAWFVLRVFYSLKAFPLIPRIKLIFIDTDISVKAPDNNVMGMPVIYVGTPGVQQKAVVTWVDVNSGKPITVMKMALKPGAAASLTHEANILESLKILGLKNTPILLKNDKQNGIIWQSIISGQLSARPLKNKHINWLLSLPRTDNITTLNQENVILEELLESAQSHLSTNNISLIKNAIKQIKGNEDIPLILVHGDFSPWNIKQQENNQLSVIDWEDATLNGLPLWDLCHFYFIQAYLFKDSSPLNVFFSDQKISCYLHHLNIPQDYKYRLVLLYMLKTIFQPDSNASKEYKNFILTQLIKVMNQ